MRRALEYMAETPIALDDLRTNQDTMVSIGKVMQAMIGGETSIRGFEVIPTIPASMQVNIGVGEIYKYSNLEDTIYGDPSSDQYLPIDTSDDHKIVKQGILRDSVLSDDLVAPSTAGHKIEYLVQVGFGEELALQETRLFYQQTSQLVYSAKDAVANISIKAGISHLSTDPDQPPVPDGGTVGAYYVSISYGQTEITSASIHRYADAPFINAINQPATETTAGIIRIANELEAKELNANNIAIVPSHLKTIIKHTFRNLNGLVMSNNISSPNTHIDITAGSCLNSDDSIIMELPVNYTKRIDQTWAPGNGNGGLAATLSIIPNTWYHLFLIGKADGTTDLVFDTDTGAVHRDVTYPYYRRIGAVRIDIASHITPFVETEGRAFHFKNSYLLTATLPHTSDYIATILTPLGVRVLAHFNVIGNPISSSPDNASYQIYILPTTDDLPGMPYQGESSTSLFVFNDTHKTANGSGAVITDTSSHVQVSQRTTSGGDFTRVQWWLNTFMYQEFL